MRPASTAVLAVVVVALCAAPSFGRPRGGGERTKRKVGDLAPAFDLVELDEEGGARGTTSLSGFRGKTPVVLVFGSYT